MADFRPFCAIRPVDELADQVAALPYDVYSREEAREKVKGDKLSFLCIDRAETQLPAGIDIYSDEVYAKAASLLRERIAEGVYKQDAERSYYLYELTWQGVAQTGIVGCASVKDYENNIVRKHEKTRADKEIDRIRHVDALSAQTGPIFLAFRSNPEIKKVLASVKEAAPMFDFVADDGIRHRGWKISDAALVGDMGDLFEQIPVLYIADGHHRAASAVRVGQNRRAENPDAPQLESDHFLSVAFPHDELRILDYNRIIKDLNGMTGEEFLEKLSEDFDISEEKEPVRPAKKGEFGFLLENRWYRLTIHPELVPADPVSSLDVSLLQELVCSKMLNIQDPKTDHRIDFVGGVRGLKELERRHQNGWACAVSMYPTSIEELFAVADEDRLMPPKSTWFEPKLRSGLFIHGLEGLI